MLCRKTDLLNSKSRRKATCGEGKNIGKNISGNKTPSAEQGQCGTLWVTPFPIPPEPSQAERRFAGIVFPCDRSSKRLPLEADPSRGPGWAGRGGSWREPTPIKRDQCDKCHICGDLKPSGPAQLTGILKLPLLRGQNSISSRSLFWQARQYLMAQDAFPAPVGHGESRSACSHRHPTGIFGSFKAEPAA